MAMCHALRCVRPRVVLCILRVAHGASIMHTHVVVVVVYCGVTEEEEVCDEELSFVRSMFIVHVTKSTKEVPN